MSVFSYNSISLQLIKTNSVERIVRLSDDRTEYMWTDFIIDITCIYNPAATSYAQDGTQQAGILPMVTDTAIRSILMQPRQALLYQEGGITILEINPNIEGGNSIECDNGPLPQSVNISKIGSSRIFWINYVIKTSIYECPSGSPISQIASSRYSRTESIDEDFISTLTTSGITYFRSSVLNSLNTNADFYRSYIIPQTFLGYKRTNVTFSLDSNGTVCRWSTTDVEQKQELGAFGTPGTAASIGITKMGLVYHVGALQGGPMGTASYGSIATVNVWAQAMKGNGTTGTNRYSMMQFITTIAYQKLQNVAPLGMVAGGSFSEDVFNNRVEMNISYVILDDAAGFVGIPMPVTNSVGNQINLPSLQNNTGLNPQPIFANGTRGTAAYLLAVSSFATACSGFNPQDPTATIIDPNSDSPAVQTGLGPQVQAFFDPGNPSPPNPQQSIRQNQKEQSRSPGTSGVMYEESPGRSNYINTQGIIQLPIASSVNDVLTGLGGGGGNQPTCVNIQLFQPTSKKVIEWSQTRIGAVPEPPDATVPDQLSENYTLMTNNISTNMIEVMADGVTPIYRCSGVYSYSLLNPINPQDYVPFDIPPWINMQPSAYTQLQPDDFEEGIINNQSNGSQNPGSQNPGL